MLSVLYLYRLILLMGLRVRLKSAPNRFSAGHFFFIAISENWKNFSGIVNYKNIPVLYLTIVIQAKVRIQ